VKDRDGGGGVESGSAGASWFGGFEHGVAMLRDCYLIIRDEAGLAQLSMKSWLEALGQLETLKPQDTVIERVAASFPT